VEVKFNKFKVHLLNTVTVVLADYG